VAWEAALRLPLACGDAGFRLVRITCLGGAVAFGPLFFARDLPVWALYVVGGLAALWVLRLAMLAKQLWTARASDVRVDREGLSVLSGPFAGRVYPWSALAETRVHTRDGETSFSVGDDVLARTRHFDEAWSLRSLAKTLAAGASDRTPAGPLGPEVAKCAQCGAAVVPADALSVVCGYCGHENALPPRVQHAAGVPQTDERLTRALKALLAWPRARPMNVFLGASFAIAVLAWPALAALAALAHAQRVDVSVFDLMVLFSAALTLGFTFPALVARAATRRRSFEMLSARFAASAPAKPGEPYGCRRCGGPLPDPHGRSTTPAVAACAYCDAHNVVGLGLAREALAARTDAATLSQMVREQRALQRRHRLYSVLPVLWLVYTPIQVADAFFGEVCFLDGAACTGPNEARWCFRGAPRSIRCDGPRGCDREGLALYCDQSIAAPGDACTVDGHVACTADRSAMLRCRRGTSVLASACRGPLACREDGAEIRCDATVARPGDVCEGTHQSCAPDGRALLECDGRRFAVLHPTDTCGIVGGRMFWSGAYAIVGERCGEGGGACTADGRMLRCQDGRLAPFVECRGPTGCTSEGTRLQCDQSIARPGDACSGQTGACNEEGTALLRCVDGAFAQARRCPGGCRGEDGVVSCRR
jgi:DNA-directed RNA polymerase subunit RPC12/RpoP